MFSQLPTRIVPDNIADLYRRASEAFGDAPAFASRAPGGAFAPMGYRELYETGLQVATALIDLGVQPRDHVAILSDNRLEWILSDCGVLIAGAADVPRAADVTAAEIEYILRHADVRVAFVENMQVLSKVRSCGLKTPILAILLDPKADPPDGAMLLESLIELGRTRRMEGDRRAEARLSRIKPGDLFTLIYTSGTTGTPKGVQLTHANMVSQIRNLPFDLHPSDRALSILPVWHSYERVFEMIAMSWGVCTYYTTIRNIAEDLRSVKPTVMASAPRLWENLYLKVLSKVESGGPLKRMLFKFAYQAARRVKRAEQFFAGQELDMNGRPPMQALAGFIGHLVSFLVWQIPYRSLDRMVLGTVRKVVGGKFRGTISGGGALQPHVDEFFNFIGIPVLEGYGLTETSPVLAVRTWKNLVIGTVGPIFPETEVRIVDLQTGAILYPSTDHPSEGRGLRGEIHVRGPQIMKGYYKDEDATARVLKDGWLNTGDIGMMTFNDCLKILGRSKDTIVLLSGENVEPLPIECRLTHSPYIAQCIVVGQDRKFLGALLVPCLDTFRNAGIPADHAGRLAEHPEARAIIDSEIKRVVSAETGFKQFERVAAWRLIPKSFEIGDELTNTLKLKRHVVTERYRTLIDEMYE